MNCKSTNKAKRAVTGGPGRDDTRLMNNFKKETHKREYAMADDFSTDYVSWSPLL